MTPPRWSVDQADATAWLQALPVAYADLIITDPPYASLEKHRAVGTTTRLKTSWFPVVANEAFVPLLRAAYMALKPGRHLYVFTDAASLPVLHDAATKAGFTVWNILTWDKARMGMGYHYRRRTEFILFCERPGARRKLANLGIPDLLTVKAPRGGYPTEKPLDLLRVLVRQSALAGELVVDPFTGSGSTGHAALLEGCAFAGCDITPHGVAWARGRLDAAARMLADACPTDAGGDA